MTRKLIIKLMLITPLSLWCSYAAALSGSDIQHLAEEFVIAKAIALEEKGFRVEWKLGKISPQLRFTECANASIFDLKRDPLEASSNSLEVACESPNWRIYVPVEFKIYTQVLAASQSIPKGSVIQPYHLEKIEQQFNSIRYGSYQEAVQVTGMLAKRTIKQGSVIKPSHLKAPMLVSRGDQVLISAENDKLNIQMKGEALNSGVLGEQISVKNLSSDRIIRAQVVERGRVSVLL